MDFFVNGDKNLSDGEESEDEHRSSTSTGTGGGRRRSGSGDSSSGGSRARPNLTLGDDAYDFVLRLSDDEEEEGGGGAVNRPRYTEIEKQLKEDGHDDIKFEDPVMEEVLYKAALFNCGCKNNCSNAIGGPEELLRCQLDMLAFSQNEKDLILMSQIQAHLDNADTTSCSKRKEQKQRSLSRLQFYHKRKEICRNTFKFIYHVSQSKLTNVKKWYLKEGFTHVDKHFAGAKNCKKAMNFNGLFHFLFFLFMKIW